MRNAWGSEAQLMDPTRWYLQRQTSYRHTQRRCNPNVGEYKLKGCYIIPSQSVCLQGLQRQQPAHSLVRGQCAHDAEPGGRRCRRQHQPKWSDAHRTGGQLCELGQKAAQGHARVTSLALLAWRLRTLHVTLGWQEVAEGGQSAPVDRPCPQPPGIVSQQSEAWTSVQKWGGHVTRQSNGPWHQV